MLYFAARVRADAFWRYDLATLRKGDLAGKVAGKLGGPRSSGDAALNAVLDSVREALASGDRVVLTGFGAFEARHVKERQVRSIRGRQAGQRVVVPAHKRVSFRPGTLLSQNGHKIIVRRRDLEHAFGPKAVSRMDRVVVS